MVDPSEYGPTDIDNLTKNKANKCPEIQEDEQRNKGNLFFLLKKKSFFKEIGGKKFKKKLAI